jgi:hypothetical protein
MFCQQSEGLIIDRDASDLFTRFLQTICKITGAFYCSPGRLWKGLSGGGGGCYEDAHDHGGW